MEDLGLDKLLRWTAQELGEIGWKAWADHGDRLARQLSDVEWDAVERAYESIAELVSEIPYREDLRDWQSFARTDERIEDALTRLS